MRRFSYDTHSRITPMGIGFWDELTSTLVSDGLEVEVWPSEKPDQKIRASCNRSGIFYANRLPGLSAFSMNVDDALYWINIGNITREFTISVRDTWESFLPFSFEINLPKKGVVTPMCGSPPVTARQGEYTKLFSAATRRLPSTYAQVRAELVYTDLSQELPASWAIAEAWVNGSLVATGMADEKGRLLMAFPYPAPRLISTSPPEPWRMGQSTWQLELRIRYQPNSSVFSLARTSGSKLPSLCRLLQQPILSVIDAMSPLTLLPLQTLRYGSVLVIRSSCSDSGQLLLTT